MHVDSELTPGNPALEDWEVEEEGVVTIRPSHKHRNSRSNDDTLSRPSVSNIFISENYQPQSEVSSYSSFWASASANMVPSAKDPIAESARVHVHSQSSSIVGGMDIPGYVPKS